MTHSGGFVAVGVGEGSMALSYPAWPCTALLAVPSQSRVPISTVPWPVFTRQLSFLQYQLCAEQPETPLTLLGRRGLALGEVEPGKD